MQNLIASLILSAASLYLLLKWLPSSFKQGLGRWLARRHPALGKIFSSTAKACASACSSSCNGCDADDAPVPERQDKRVIPIRRR
ncbi:MAG: hypothetical protein HYZ65_07925 [Burkholderiales bacterium]|nr:hypothetical protein [Burkholderiales bacterium]